MSKPIRKYDYARGISFVGGCALLHCPEHPLRNPGDDDMALTGDVEAVYLDGIKLSYTDACVLVYAPDFAVLEATIETRNTIYIPS